MVFTSTFLRQQDINRYLVSFYVQSGWISSIGSGAYIRSSDEMDWYGGLNALQQQLGLAVHLGGKSALVSHGFGHYTHTGRELVFLFLNKGIKLPPWFRANDWQVDFKITRTALLPHNLKDSFTHKTFNGFDIRLSTPERAVLEMLYYIPEMQGFDEAVKILESTSSLRPKLIQNLLENCNSVKVKRLFLYMAEKINHPWFAQLDVRKIELGKGKRLIVRHGRLDRKYQITVPGDQTF